MNANSHRDPTPYQDLNSVLAELTQGTEAVLAQTLVGNYLQGSFAAGGFDQHSDVDFIAIIRQELTDEQVSGLQSMHGRIYDLDCTWAQRLEGSYFPLQVLQNPPKAVDKLWYLDNGSRQLIRSQHCNTLVVRWTVRTHGIPLLGPHPAEVIPPVAPAAMRWEILEVIHNWGSEILTTPAHFNNRFYQSFIVLSFCRMLHSLHTGRIESKRCSADWAKTALDPAWADLIDRTWAGRPDPSRSVRTPADPADFQRTLEFIRYITTLADNLGIIG